MDLRNVTPQFSATPTNFAYQKIPILAEEASVLAKTTPVSKIFELKTPKTSSVYFAKVGLYFLLHYLHDLNWPQEEESLLNQFSCLSDVH